MSGNEDCSQIGAEFSSHNSWIVLRPLVQIEDFLWLSSHCVRDIVLVVISSFT